MTTPSPIDLLRTLAQRIDAVPAVARRSGGMFGVAAAYLPGERIEGLRLRDDALEVHVVMNWEFTVDDVERQVLEAIGDVWTTSDITLVIDDIIVPNDEPVRPVARS